MSKSFKKCRLCLKLGDFTSIFEKDDSVKLSEMVMAFARIQILEGDGLTDRVCSPCIEKLSTVYLFKLQCEKSDQILRTCIDNVISLHTNEYDTIQCSNELGENNDNRCKEDSYHTQARDTSDETDSDLESVKCVYCDEPYNSGAHTCNVTCTIEKAGSTGSDETLVASDLEPPDFFSANSTLVVGGNEVSCVLCDNKYDRFDLYVRHFEVCTANVKLRYFVCSICHEIHTQKDAYLEHLNAVHFKETVLTEVGVDTVDHVPKSSCRKIGWSIEDIYQEIGPVEEKVETPTSSPLKTFFSRLGNESFSSTPRKVSFRKLLEDSKAKTSNYLPFKRYINSYRQKKKEPLYSPVVPKSQRIAQLQITDNILSDSDYTPSSTSEDSWKLKQNLICACDKKVFMLSDHLENRQRIVSQICELGGVVAESTKLEMLATHYIAVLPRDSHTGMMVCALSTGKWLLHPNYVHDSYRGKTFLSEALYEWTKQPLLLEIDNTSIELAKAASYWRYQLSCTGASKPFEGSQVVLIMKKKYRQYYQMVFKTLKAKAIAYDPRTPGSCCSANYCFVDMRIIERVKLKFFSEHNIPVLPYQYILVHLLNRGHVADQHKYLIQPCKKSTDTVDLLNKTF